MKTRLSILALLIALSSAAGEFREVKNIPYYAEDELAQRGDYARNRCLIDLKYPLGVTNYTTVVNIHGGGLVSGNKCYCPWPLEKRADDPLAFAGVGYRLLTNATPVECVSDAAAAVAWIVKHIAEYGGDPKKVFVTGVSGGGYQTAMIGMDPKWLAVHGLKPTDLAGIAPLTGQMTKHFNVRKVGFEDSDPQFLPKIDEWAPLAYASTNPIPPVAFMTGGRDVEWKSRVEENALLASALRANRHDNVEFHETEGSHGGGVTPSSYFLRDFVLKTVDADAVGRFLPHERVSFFGDSITHNGRYTSYLQLFVALRYPGWGVRCYNCGISGNTALHGIRRLGWDLKKQRPTRVFVMFGMNDVGCKNWIEGNPSEQVLTARTNALDSYAKNMDEIVNWLGKTGIKRVLMTPTPYDQYSDAPATNYTHCNEMGLSACAEIVRKLAASNHLGVVDFHRPMTKILREHPNYRLCGDDRIHPTHEGNLLMAALVLEAMGERPLVARVSVDAVTGMADPLLDRGSRNVILTETSGDPTNGVAFTYAPKALPFPVSEEYLAVEKLYPLTKRLNQEDFVVRGLADGRYRLLFDGVEVGAFTAQEFDKGVNVALLNTPNQQRARAVAEIARELQERQAKLRQYLRRNPNAETDVRRRLSVEIEDLIERVNSVRPSVSRVRIAPIR